MGWLKKVGQIVLQASSIVVGLGPVAGMMIPGKKDDEIIKFTQDTLAQVATVIQQVEVFGQALGIQGPDKLKAAAPAVAQIILQSALMARHEIGDPFLFQRGCSKIADGMADIQNSWKEKVDQINKL